MRGRRQVKKMNMHGFQKTVVGCSLLCFVIIWAVTVYRALTGSFTNLTSTDESTDVTTLSSLGWGWRIMLMLVLAAVLLWFFRMVFRHFANCSMRRLRVDVVLLFLCSLVLYLILISQFRIVPITDSHSVLDQAMYLARNGLDSLSTDNVYANYFSKYANNYPVTLLFAGYFWLMEKLEISDMYLSSYLLNMCCLLLGSLFGWLAAKRAFGPRTAAKVLLLCVMNPVYYLMVFWVYTNTISVPFVMALIYLALCVRDAKNWCIRMALAAVFGAVAAVGIQIRATTAIPVIAIAICFGMKTICYLCLGAHMEVFQLAKDAPRAARRGQVSLFDCKLRKNYKSILRNYFGWTGTVVVALIVTVGVSLSISNTCNYYFQSVSEGNYPVTHWLMMGSHGNGTYNTTDDGYTFSYETAEEKKDATLTATIENYKELGVLGTVQLFIRKMTITWSDGYFAADQRLGQTMQYTPLYSLLVGEQSDFFQLYCQVFWLAVGFFVICACIRCLTEKKMRMLPFLLILTLFGAIVFYWFWEVKAAYALPFLPIFYLLAGYGSGMWQKEDVIWADRTGEEKSRTEKERPGKKNGIIDEAGLDVMSEREENTCEHVFDEQQLSIMNEVHDISKISNGDIWEIIAIFALIILFAIAAYQKMNSYEITHFDYSIYSNGGSWMKSIDLDEGESVTQEFYPNADFNRIALRVKVQSEEDTTNDCKLHVTLTDAEGTVVYQGVITAADVHDQMAVLSVGEHPADTQGGYVLTITKETGSSGNLFLRTRKGLCLDDYRGTFTVCGEAQVTDLYLQVYREYTGDYLSL